MSPLAEGRELKYGSRKAIKKPDASPLAEGRELKFMETLENHIGIGSPLAEGRELKFENEKGTVQRAVAPRGGA